MTDLHTHILPGMDDGAKTVEESLQMLRMEKAQGVDVVALTPHFYRDRERPEHFLKRRKEAAILLRNAMEKLTEEELENIPRPILGAEVALFPNLAEIPELHSLCIGKTKNLLVEMPFTPWNDIILRQLYDLLDKTDVIPVIAHLERYFKIQKPERIQEIMDLGVAIQISSDVLQHPMSRGNVLRMMKNGGRFFLASDCHNTESRPPNLEKGMEIVRKKLGESQAETMVQRTARLAGQLM
jgi:protein-tyrosine phosphatase